ncbi:hypothetical protein Bbelb_017650 [Branchiostoma belcheri]|nr:hypothetical protein Bbelb_017650 [Branchiostoma belcheri]
MEYWIEKAVRRPGLRCQSELRVVDRSSRDNRSFHHNSRDLSALPKPSSGKMLMSTISPYLNFSTWVSLYPNMTVTGSPPWEENSTFGYGTAPTPRYYPYPGYEHPDTAEVTIKIVVYSLLLLMALVGNPIVILIVSLNKTMWTPTNFYIMNLAIADLLIALFCMWIHLVQSMIPNWIFGDFMCRFNNFIQERRVVPISISVALGRHTVVQGTTAGGRSAANPALHAMDSSEGVP